MKVFNNIAVKQINFDGASADNYLSDNVYYRNKKINQIRFLAAPSGKTMKSPFDGTTLVDESELNNFVANFVKDDKQVLTQNFGLLNIGILSNTFYDIEEVVDFNLSYITYLGDPATLTGKSLLMYVYWDVEEVDDEAAQDIRMAVGFSATGVTKPLKISDYIDEWIRRSNKTVKGISCLSSSLFYVDLRSEDGRVFEKVPSLRLRENLGSSSLPILKRPVYLRDFDVDFKNSWVIPAEASIDFTLIIYY